MSKYEEIRKYCNMIIRVQQEIDKDLKKPSLYGIGRIEVAEQVLNLLKEKR